MPCGAPTSRASPVAKGTPDAAARENETVPGGPLHSLRSHPAHRGARRGSHSDTGSRGAASGRTDRGAASADALLGSHPGRGRPPRSPRPEDGPLRPCAPERADPASHALPVGEPDRGRGRGSPPPGRRAGGSPARDPEGAGRLRARDRVDSRARSPHRRSDDRLHLQALESDAAGDALPARAPGGAGARSRVHRLDRAERSSMSGRRRPRRAVGPGAVASARLRGAARPRTPRSPGPASSERGPAPMGTGSADHLRRIDERPGD